MSPSWSPRHHHPGGRPVEALFLQAPPEEGGSKFFVLLYAIDLQYCSQWAWQQRVYVAERQLRNWETLYWGRAVRQMICTLLTKFDRHTKANYEHDFAAGGSYGLPRMKESVQASPS